MSLGDSVVWQGTTYTKNPSTGFYVSDEDDGGIIDQYGNYYDTASGEYVGNVSKVSQTPVVGGFWSTLLNNIEGQITDPQNIKSVVQSLIGSGALPPSASTNTPNPKYTPQPAKSNTVLYAVLGVVAVGVGIFIYSKMKKK